MPRVARKYSKSSFYHIIVQGLNKEYIFNTEFYIRKYQEFILKKIDRKEIEILAYCIMNNHAHFLIYSEKNEQLAKFMQKVNTSYSRFYNKENKRVGYVFRDRYLSQEIMDEKQLYCCLNYIHNNPVKAGIVKKAEEYKYSSLFEFFYGRKIVTNKGIKLLFGTEKNYKEQLLKISDLHSDRNFIDVKEEKKDIMEFIKEVEELYHRKANLFKNDKDLLKDIIKKAREETDVTIIKLAEILEISKSYVGKYAKK